jgi:hypothetical protein
MKYKILENNKIENIVSDLRNKFKSSFIKQFTNTKVISKSEYVEVCLSVSATFLYQIIEHLDEILEYDIDKERTIDTISQAMKFRLKSN